MNKTTWTVVAVVVILGLGAYLAFANKASAPTQSPTATSTASGSDQKINIDEVCNSALAYMSFPDAASAEAFVEECKRGEHPEVIERWKADNGYGDGAAI